MRDAVAHLADKPPSEQRAVYNRLIRYVILKRPDTPRIVWIWQ
jgi:hypothetical protein